MKKDILKIREELEKLLLGSKKPSDGLEKMKTSGILKKFFPEFLKLSGCHQEPAWHPEGDVWEHTKLVVDSAAQLSKKRKFSETDRFVILLSAFCHDLGKAKTTKKLNGRIRSSGHSEIGCQLAQKFLQRFGYSKQIIKNVSIIVLEHRWPPRLLKNLKNKELNQSQYISEVKKLSRRLGKVSLEVFLTVCEADFRGKKQLESFVAGKKLRKVLLKNDLSTSGF